MPKSLALNLSSKGKTLGEAKNRQCHRDALLKKYQSILVTNPELNRRLVSFQANRQTEERFRARSDLSWTIHSVGTASFS
jgi:hypothetical protein